jgi:S1-C subfamily serine protease
MILGGDIIAEADGQSINSMAELDRVIEKKRPGDTVNLKVYRQGREMAVRVALIERTRPGQFL